MYQLLDHERRGVAALTVRAIAEAWDCGRIAAPTELPHLVSVPGLLGVHQGLAPGQLAAAEEALAEAAQEAAAAGDAAHSTPLDELVAEAALTPLGRMIMLLVAAPQLWGEIAQLYAVLANGASRPMVDEHLVRALLGPRLVVHELARELDADAPLVRNGLVEVDPRAPRPFAGLALHPLALARLRGHPLSADPDRVVEVVADGRDLDDLLVAPGPAATLAALAARGPDPGSRLVVAGRPGSGRRTLLAALARRCGRRLAMLRLERLRMDGSGRASAADLAAALRRCLVAGWVPCVDGLAEAGPSGDDRTWQQQLAMVIADHPAPVVVRVERGDVPPLAPGYVRIDLPDLDEGARTTIWQGLLGTSARSGDVMPGTAMAELAARWRIGAGTIHAVAAQVAPPGAPAPSAAQIDAAVSQHVRQGLGDVAELVTALPALSDVILPTDILDSLVEFQARIRLRRQVFEQWGMAQVATTGRGLTALFAGPPGTGKTMVAGALARELGLELYRVDLSRIMSKWIGETERNLARVFAAAEQSQAIILFDEADSLFSKRTEVRSSNDRFANLEVNYLLQRLDSYLGVVILTTNAGSAIDPAFRRRLAFRITFPVPDDELREQLWRAHLPASLPLADDVDLAELAHRYALTGGSVRNCVMRAAFLAAAESCRVSQAHLQRAIAVEYRSVGKLTEGGALE